MKGGEKRGASPKLKRRKETPGWVAELGGESGAGVTTVGNSVGGQSLEISLTRGLLLVSKFGKRAPTERKGLISSPAPKRSFGGQKKVALQKKNAPARR